MSTITVTDQKKQWEELHFIRCLPKPIAEKRSLKAQLKNLPVVTLKGKERLGWMMKRMREGLILRWKRLMRRNVIWQKSLQDIEVRAGTPVVNVFLFIRWTVYFNFLLFLILYGCIIIPYMILPKLVEPRRYEHCPANFSSRSLSNMDLDWDPEHKYLQLAQCCVRAYYADIKLDQHLWSAFKHAVTMNSTQFGFSPLTYGFYSAYRLDIPTELAYNFQRNYLLVQLGIFLVSLIIMVWQIGLGIKEMTMTNEAEFYKFSNLIFAGWDHYTRDQASANFKRKILKNEMRIALKTEKLKVSTLSKKQRYRLLMKRILANVLVLIVICIIGVIIYFAADFSIGSISSSNSNDLTSKPDLWVENQAGRFLAPCLIAACNQLFPVFLRRVIRRLELYTHEVQTTVMLMRTLVVRILSIAFAGARYYTEAYCLKADMTCTFCKTPEGKSKQTEKVHCWESLFGLHIYRIVLVDLLIKVIVQVFVAYVKKKLLELTKWKMFRSATRFSIINHSLDIIYIQCLSWFFYFAPFLPLVVTIYLIIMAYIKKFTLMSISEAVPHTFRTTRTTTVYIATKLIAFVAVALTIGFVLTALEPSRSCGPFRGSRVPWDVLTADIESLRVVKYFGSPGISIPILVVVSTAAYYYYRSAQSHKSMVETLRHRIILEGHDKQYLFARLITLRQEAERLMAQHNEENLASFQK